METYTLKNKGSSLASMVKNPSNSGTFFYSTKGPLDLSLKNKSGVFTAMPKKKNHSWFPMNL